MRVHVHTPKLKKVKTSGRGELDPPARSGESVTYVNANIYTWSNNVSCTNSLIIIFIGCKMKRFIVFILDMTVLITFDILGRLVFFTLIIRGRTLLFKVHKFHN